MGVGGMPAELVVGRLDGEARRTARHQDRRDLRLAVRRRAGARRHGHDGGDVGAGVGDEGLGTVDDPLIAVEAGLGAGGAGVGAGLGLGQAEGRERATGHQVGQPALLLLLGAVGEDRVDPEPDTGRQRDADGLVDPAQLLDGHAQRRERPGGIVTLAGGRAFQAAAVLLGHHQAEQPQVAHPRHQLDREAVLAVPLRGVRRHVVLGELAHHRAEVLVVLAELERHGASASGDRPALDVNVKVKQDATRGKRAEHRADRRGVRRHPSHGPVLRGPRPDHPGAPRHPAGLPPPRPGPARPDPARQAARASPSRRSPGSSTCTTTSPARPASCATCSPRSRTGGPTSSSAARTCWLPWHELDELERRCQQDLAELAESWLEIELDRAGG